MSQYPNSFSFAQPNSSPSYEDSGLQAVINALFSSGSSVVSRLDVILAAEAYDVDEDLQDVVSMLPPGTYSRARLCDQLNSTIAARGWGRTHGMVN